MSESVMTVSRNAAPRGSKLAERTGVFLLSNSLEIGGSERQFAALVEALDRKRFEVQAGCLRRIGPLAARLPDLPEFPVGGSLFRLQSIRARRRMARFMREHEIRVAHAFDFYSNMTLIPGPVLLGSPLLSGVTAKLGI